MIALEKVKSGVSLGLPLSNQLRTSGLFPPMVVHMVVGIGEETGNVEEMFTNSAVYYEEEVEVQTDSYFINGTYYYCAYGFCCCTLILAIYQPMIQLYNTLGSQG